MQKYIINAIITTMLKTVKTKLAICAAVLMLLLAKKCPFVGNLMAVAPRD